MTSRLFAGLRKAKQGGMSLRCRLMILLCLPGLLHQGLLQAAPAGRPAVAAHTDRLRHLVDRLQADTALRQRPVTLILETDRLTDGVLSLLSAHGGKLRYSRGRRHETRLPADRLSRLLPLLPPGVFARLPYPHRALAVTSQGVGMTGAADMQTLGNDGAGVKVGVIDLGFAGYADSQASGDLPAGLSITDYTGSGTGGTDHGTNVAEIVHDMAPGAELYLAKVGTSLQLEQAVNDMVAAGVQVINHSVAWFGAAFYDGTGPLCDIADNAEAAGVQWVNAAGNYRNGHYLGTFGDADGDLRHEFAAGQNYNTVDLNAGSSLSLILNWDAYPVTDVDYNLELYDGDPDAGGTLVASSASLQTGTSFSYPYEVIDYTAAVAGTYYIVVRKKNSAAANLPLTLFSTGPALGVKTRASSIVQPADCYSVIAAAATDLTDGPEWFSSEGPTVDGRDKPEVSAPNRVQTSKTGSFAGTSAAAPHVAGAAALLLAQNPAIPTTQLRDLLKTSVTDVSLAGYDYRTGFGRTSLDADLDGYNHDDDNCPTVYNPGQEDGDGNGVGNVCEPPVIDGVGVASDPNANSEFIYVFGRRFAGDNRVTVNGSPATAFQLVGKKQLIVLWPKDPQNPLSSVNTTVTVSNDFGTATSPPVSATGLSISGVWPAKGGVSSFVYLFGSGFLGNISIDIGGVPVTAYHVYDDNVLAFLVPLDATTGIISVASGTESAAWGVPFVVK